MKKLIISGFAAASLLAAGAVRAEEVMVRVNFSDLDLSRAGDVAKLRKRVRSAVRQACAPAASMLNAMPDTRCVRDAVAMAETQIESGRTVAIAMAMNERR